MFDDPFVFFALVIAIVALIFARKAMNQVAELRQRLEAIQAAPATAAVPGLRRSRHLKRSSRPCRRPRPWPYRHRRPSFPTSNRSRLRRPPRLQSRPQAA